MQLHNYCLRMRKFLVKPKFFKSWRKPVNQYTNRFAWKYYRESGVWPANVETVHSRKYRRWRDIHVLQTIIPRPSSNSM